MMLSRYAVFAFMASVTCYLLGRVFVAPGSVPELVAYSATAAVGLEFLISYWRSLWTDHPATN
jgi:hypothetical protein